MNAPRGGFRLKGWQIFLLVLAGFVCFTWVGGTVADFVPRRHHALISGVGGWAGSLALIGFIVYSADKLPAGQHPGWKYVFWTLLIVGSVAYF